VLELAPPWQPASAPPSTPTPTPQRSIGRLTGRVIPFPFRSEGFPRPVVLPLGPAAYAAVGMARETATIAVPAAADNHLTFFMIATPILSGGRARDGRRFSARTPPPAMRRRPGPRRNYCSSAGRSPR